MEEHWPLVQSGSVIILLIFKIVLKTKPKNSLAKLKVCPWRFY